jgi:Nucleotidyl transferase AbiEii toxin, Type IV TA system
MNAIERALRDFLAVRPPDVAIAVVGGLAVSARVEPRFTRDLDFAVAVTNDDEATRYVFRIRQVGYEIVSALEQTTQRRLSTVRLRRDGRGPIVDLLLGACGIEAEIARAAQPLEITAGLVADVAQVGHLIAMKLVSRDPKRRPRDQQDLVDLAGVADAAEWARAAAAVDLIAQRGFARGRDLRAGLAELRSLADGDT